MNEYEKFRRVCYGDDGLWTFVPVCPICGRFVKADESINVGVLTGVKHEPNATCKRCGRVEMPCEGCL